MTDSEEVGICIAYLRLARRWNQSELAERAGITNSAISDYERGKVDPQTQTLLKILDGLNAPMQLFDLARDFLSRARAVMEGGSLLSTSGDGELPDLPPLVAAEIAAIASEGASFTARATRMQLGFLAHLVHGQKRE